MTEHHIEERAVVNLRLGTDGRWEIDSPTFDGYELEGYEGGPVADECQCGDETSCAEALEAARRVPLPSAVELLALLQAEQLAMS